MPAATTRAPARRLARSSSPSNTPKQIARPARNEVSQANDLDAVNVLSRNRPTVILRPSAPLRSERETGQDRDDVTSTNKRLRQGGHMLRKPCLFRGVVDADKQKLQLVISVVASQDFRGFCSGSRRQRRAKAGPSNPQDVFEISQVPSNQLQPAVTIVTPSDGHLRDAVSRARGQPGESRRRTCNRRFSVGRRCQGLHRA